MDYTDPLITMEQKSGSPIEKVCLIVRRQILTSLNLSILKLKASMRMFEQLSKSIR